jgi:hypothetical protein
MTKDEMDDLAEAIASRMEARYVTHAEMHNKFERCFAFDCLDPKARDRKHADNKFLERLHEGSRVAGGKLLMWVLTAFGVGALTAIFGPGWIDKIKGG